MIALNCGSVGLMPVCRLDLPNAGHLIAVSAIVQ